MERLEGTVQLLSGARRLGLLLAVLLIALSGCKNPFAPRLEKGGGDDGSILGNQQTIDGVFRNFQYAYTFKDTAIYGRLLDGTFTFLYVDYDHGTQVSWGREEDVRTTYGLFANAQKLDLVWNNIAFQSGDSLRSMVTRAFSLTVTFNPSDIVRVEGYANLTLMRLSAEADWRIAQWRDESNY